MHQAHHLDDDEISEEELNEALDEVRAGKSEVVGNAKMRAKMAKAAMAQKDLKKSNQNLKTLIEAEKKHLQRTLEKIERDRKKKREKDVYTKKGQEFA